MAELTFCIPIGPAHEHLADRAIASARAQTVPCEILTFRDAERRGPGVLRNQMLAEVNTEFVTFLDADDWVEPTFAAETIAEFRRIGGNKYIFTDWTNDYNLIVEAPCLEQVSVPGQKPYCGGTWHALTTLIPTAWVRAIGGFDESFSAVEDTDFYMKLSVARHCGHRLKRPLFHYSAGGGRGERVRGTLELASIQNELTRRYGGKMGCCGDENKPEPPIGQKQPGDVVARAKWVGKRSEVGRVSGRHYPNIAMNAIQNTAWVDPRDVLQNPNLWEIVEQPKPVDEPQPVTSVRQLANLGMSTIVKSPYAPPQNEPPVPPVNATPNVSRVVRLAQKAMGNGETPGILAVKAPISEDRFQQIQVAFNAANEQTDKTFGKTLTINTVRNPGDPVFVFADKDYPSYGDIKRLVELSGFRAMPISKVDVFSRAPLIVVTPEPIGDRFRGVASRVICWQLEYAGDYTHNYDGFGGEVWASDKTWADAHGAKYVLMGSHPGLAGQHPGEADYLYDVTMLAYMTPRRATIKEALKDLRWPADYPGHGTPERNAMLWETRLMLHVHQHENAPFVAPQRFAIAAAYKMPVVSEATPGKGDLDGLVLFNKYDELPETVRLMLSSPGLRDERLYRMLCVERPFRRCVEEALK